MNISDVEIHGFGIWKDLQVAELSPHMTVFYGPNEAGKSTIMQFMRAMLYGFTPQRRARYLPPVHGGKAGGRIGLRHDRELWNVRRFESADNELGALTVTGPDNHEWGTEQLRTLLCDVDENTYNNVFSLSLHELQELATLQETDAGRLLYEISAGLDRVSLGDVLRELGTSRQRMVSAGDRPCQVSELMSQRDRLRNELDQLAATWRGRRRLSDEKNDVERAIDAAEKEQSILQKEMRAAETAFSLRDLWSARAGLNEQLANIGPLENVPTDAVERMDNANSVMRKCRVRRAKLLKKKAGLMTKFKAITLNENLWKQAPRIMALVEHEPWLAALDQQTREVKTQSANLEKKLAALKQQLGISSDIASGAHESTARKLAGVLTVAKQLRQAALRLKDSRATLLNSKGTRNNEQMEIDEILTSRGETTLSAALEKTGQLVSTLRRRVHLDERLDQIARNKADLEFDLREYADMQMVPDWGLYGLSALFITGALFMLSAVLVSPAYLGGRNWTMGILGFIGVVISVIIKSHLEHTAGRKADACQKQLTLLNRQEEQATTERDELEKHIPDEQGTLQSRLDQAETELARLEELVPLESHRVTSHQESMSIRDRVNAARSAYHKARKRWVASLVAAKLPEKWAPNQVRELARQYNDLAHIHKQWEVAQQDQEHRLREVAALKARVEQLFIDTGITAEHGSLLDQIRQLRRQLANHETQSAEREELRELLLKMRRKKQIYDRAINKHQKTRERLLRSVHATDETEFRDRVHKYLQLSEITRRRDNYGREINSAIQGALTEEELLRWFKPGSKETIETRLVDLKNRLNSLQERLRQLFERRGALLQQAKAAVEDRRFASKQMELSIVEKKLRDVINRWRTYTVSQSVLENLKTSYEQDRQPETLREASDYLERLTNAQYKRVWTPLGEQRLCVDDHTGTAIPVENLSRGTREQLFLSLRLALTSWYSRRGKQLPLVLDDVLVNFDDQRAQSAAGVLRDFANQGHQMLLFTCHEHVGRIFKKMAVDVRRLPSHEDSNFWPGFEIAEPHVETRIVEVVKPVEVIKQVIVERPVEHHEPIAMQPIVHEEPVVEIKQDPPRRRRRRTDQPKVESTSVTIVEPPQMQPDTVVVDQPRMYAELRDYYPQPKPQPVYSPHSVTFQMPQTQASQPQPAITHRIDPPQQVTQQIKGVWVPQRVKWNAEEFDGELDDQVRRAQLQAAAESQLNGNQSSIQVKIQPPNVQPVIVQQPTAQPMNIVSYAPTHQNGQYETVTGVREIGQQILHEIGQPLPPAAGNIYSQTPANSGAVRRRRRRVVGEAMPQLDIEETLEPELWTNFTTEQRSSEPRPAPPSQPYYYDEEYEEE